MILDFYAIKDRYLSSRSIDAPISEHVDIQFPREHLIFKEVPHRTVLSIIKGNTLVALYKKEKEASSRTISDRTSESG
jgi:hypothetical protein